MNVVSTTLLIASSVSADTQSSTELSCGLLEALPSSFPHKPIDYFHSKDNSTHSTSVNCSLSHLYYILLFLCKMSPLEMLCPYLKGLSLHDGLISVLPKLKYSSPYAQYLRMSSYLKIWFLQILLVKLGRGRTRVGRILIQDDWDLVKS